MDKITGTVESLSRFQRRATPPALCLHLVARVLAEHWTSRVAILWTERRSHYWALWPTVELWGVGRDARTYDGPWPIIAHPPCGPWGCLKWRSKESMDCGILAIELVHRWGGVIEQPANSRLFRDHGRPGSIIERIAQRDFGHMAQKLTDLYWVNCPDGQLAMNGIESP